MATRSERTLSRHYAKLAVASSVPLIILVIALGYVHYAEQHQRRLENLLVSLHERHQKIHRTLRATENHVDQMRRWAEAYLANEDQRLSRLLPLLTVEADDKTQDITGYFLEKNVDAVQPGGTGNFLGGSLALAGGTEKLRIVSLSLDIFSIQQLGHVANLAIRHSYFMPLYRDFLSIYPASDREAFSKLTGNAKIGSAVEPFFERRVFNKAMPDVRSSRTAYWVSGEKSVINGDVLISHAAPVYETNRFVGVIGADLSQSGMRSLLRVPKFKNISGQLLDKRGRVLASIGDADSELYDALLDAPVAYQAMSDVDANSFYEANGYYLLRLPLSGIGWNVEYAVPSSVLTEGLAWRFLPYGLIIAGLIATLVFGQLLVRSQFVQPVLSFAQYIRTGARGDEEAPPVLPRIWKPWLSLLRVTFRRNREVLDRLQESEERYRQLVELSPEAIMLHDRDGISFLNQAGCSILGFANPEEAYSSSYIDFVADDEKEQASRRIAQVMDEALHIPLTERRIKDVRGRQKFIEVTATPFTNKDGDVVALVLFRDVSGRKAMEREVRESEERFRAISGAIPLPILISDTESYTLRYINPAACMQLGIDGDFLDQLTIFNLCRGPDFQKTLAELTDGDHQRDSREMDAQRPNGEKFWARVTTVPMKYEGQDALIYAIVDLTERVQAEAELALQRESFHQKEKIAALGSLLAGLAHELNNPLSVVSGQALMMEEAVSDDAISRRARRIRDAAERCSRIVRTFLSMARSKAPSLGVIDFNQTVRSALDLTSYSLQSSGVALSVDLDMKLPPLVGDADQLHHVVTNLVVNAEQAMKEIDEDRSLTVSTRPGDDGAHIVLTVADTGPGIPPEIAERIFEPFFTTKAGAVGTGIGLALCRDIVLSHGGEIRFEPNDPRGTVFTVTFPLRESTEESVEQDLIPVSPETTGKVLVVDDDQEVAKTLADFLRTRGHDVDTAFGGQEGIDMARRSQYDMIISDVRMPGVDGPGLYRTLRAENTDLDRRILFMTGDTLGVDLSDIVQEADILVIEKPLDPASVAGLIGERLHTLREDL